ncbi:MAG: helicase [Chloroflexi bacterium]|nr:helicase [Chloroflexota bacterium]
MNTVIFDLETQRSAEDVGGWDNVPDMGLSVAVTYSTADDRYRFYSEHNVDALIEQLTTADLVVGFNLLRFDYPVLSPYTSHDLRIPTLDMLDHIYRQLGHRVSLDDLAFANLGIRKSGHGLDAVTWWNEGNILAIAEYCLQDVRITRDLYRLGRSCGYLYYPTRANNKIITATSLWRGDDSGSYRQPLYAPGGSKSDHHRHC